MEGWWTQSNVPVGWTHVRPTTRLADDMQGSERGRLGKGLATDVRREGKDQVRPWSSVSKYQSVHPGPLVWTMVTGRWKGDAPEASRREAEGFKRAVRIEG